jgi:hypothetical protein
VISVRGALGIGRMWHTAMGCRAASGKEACCNRISGPVLLRGDVGAMALQGLFCAGDDSQGCCNAPAYGEEVVATGALEPSPARTGLAGDPEWSLRDVKLCFDSAQDPRPPALPPVRPSSLPRPSSSAPPPASAGSPEPLSKAAVIAGMDAVKPAVMHCYDRFRVRGVVTVNVVIGRDGTVGRAATVGSFAGTPTGACVEAAVKAARFPPSQGLSTPYPYRLE